MAGLSTCVENDSTFVENSRQPRKPAGGVGRKGRRQPLRSVPMEPDRKTLIADAAIALLGSVGARGLTHRAVDAEAGLPAGSTSFYCRSRLDLLRLALRRHATLDLADLEADALRVTQATWTRADLLALVAHRVREWLAPAQRARLVARFELFLLASREPELAEIVRELRAQFLLATQAALVRAGVSQPEARARLLAQFVDGHLLDCVGADQVQPLDEAQLRLLDRLLAD